MNGVFIDTSGLIAIVDTSDQWHLVASQKWSELMRSTVPILTTSLVLIEMADGLSRLRFRKTANELRERLTHSSRVDVIQVTLGHEVRAWELFSQRIDKEWGMTDCVSIVIAQDREVSNIFSVDHHFE